MKDILKNIWVKRGLAVFNLVYIAEVLLLTVATFLYDLEIRKGAQGAFFAVHFILSALFLVFMLYTKDIIITKITGLLLLPIVFFLVIFNMHNIVIFVPPLIVAIIMFFYITVPNNLKVLLGTIYIMLYVLGIFAYFIFNMLFGSSAVETILDENLSPDDPVYSMYDMNYVLQLTANDNTISPDGTMEFYLCDVQNKEDGQVIIYVVPHGQDKSFKFFTLKQKGIKRKVKFFYGRGKVPEVYWSGSDTLTYKMEGESEETNSTVRLPEKNYLEFIGVY